MARRKADCPICANKGPQYSKDNGNTWQCETCMGVFEAETRKRIA